MSMLTWKKPVLLSLGSLVLFATAANADSVRIVSVDGSYNPNHVSSLYVREGDLVEFNADLVKPGNFQPDNIPAQDFVWSASLVGNNFQYTNVGVNYVAPYGNWESITIYVTSSIGNYGQDSVTLINENFVVPQPFPPQPPRPLPPQPYPPQPPRPLPPQPFPPQPPRPLPPQPYPPQPPRPAPAPVPQPQPQPPRPAPAPVPAPAPQPQPPHPAPGQPQPGQPQPGQPQPGQPHPGQPGGPGQGQPHPMDASADLN